MSYESPLELYVLGNTIRVSHPAIPPNLVTYLTSSSVAGATSLTVLDNYPFVQNDLLVIGKLGLDKTEIQKINAAVTQGTALTMANTLYDHPVDTEITKILWDQVEISGAATVSGSKTVITTINLQPDRSDTVYVNTGTTYAFYFVRYKNSVTTTFSAYSSAADATGYATNTVRAAKQEALDMVNEKVDGRLITDQWLNNQVFNCEQEVWSERKKWSWAYTFDKIIGQTSEGAYSIALPTDISDSQSNKSVLEMGVRVGDRSDMGYVTKEEWDEFFVLTRHTTVATAITSGDLTINLTSVSDLDDSGSIVIGSDSSIQYTGRNTSTNQLTGCTGVSANHSAGQDVWQNATFAEPAYFTVFNGSMYFQAGCHSTYAGKNIYLSYYRKPTAISTDSDTLNIPDFTIYHYYIAWKILLRKNNGQATEESEKMRAQYEGVDGKGGRKNILKVQDRTGQYVLMRPRLNTIRYPRTEVKTTFTQVDY